VGGGGNYLSPPDNHLVMNDAELVARALGGDRDAFAAIYHRYHAVVYRFARMMSGSAAVAEDVTQETFIVLMQDLQRYAPSRAALGTYLYGVARNLTRARLRRERRFVGLDCVTHRAAHDSDPCEATDDFRVRDSLRRAILELPSRYREVVILCGIHGLSYEDAAAALKTPLGTVRSRLSRGKQALAKRLLEEQQRTSVAGKAARCMV
jgi:RNA polymerase sigma-70 factor, ECF subfamily